MFASTCTYQMLSNILAIRCGYMLNFPLLLMYGITFIFTLFGIQYGYIWFGDNIFIGLMISLVHTMWIIYSYSVSTKYNDIIGLVSLYLIQYGLIYSLNVEIIVSMDIPFTILDVDSRRQFFFCVLTFALIWLVVGNLRFAKVLVKKHCFCANFPCVL